MSSLILQGVSYHYNGTKVIHDLDLTVGKDEIVCLLGASGCGKTTTLKAIAGLIEAKQGSIFIDGKLVSDEQSFVSPEHRNIGMMFQDYALFPHLTVANNIAFGLSNMSKAQKQQRVDEMLKLVHLIGCADRFPHQLSGGQQQRVAIARALAYKPSLLLLDEPFSNIDTQVRFELIADIRRIIKATQVSAVFVTHSKEEAFAFSDTLAIMHRGKIEQQGTPEQLFAAPCSKEVAEFLGQGIYLSAEVLTATEYKTPFGLVESYVESKHNVSAGLIYVRPHQIELVADNQSDKFSKRATIISRRFIGSAYVYSLVIDEQEIEVAAQYGQSFENNDQVIIKIKPHTVNFFES
ncbi:MULTISPECIES: ABC transporter ATP-binding protein [unclassified Pseudoalteromonas]|uniref:ABC transporter ATP-binding protein n=1 Tax=unclassified Pseudoalteromonas TaxID=194690 RepID=UPI000404AAEF|nr:MULTISPECIES: ABC transporter ATP-binding protein [unclassified Pseudoalteromonas]MBB1305727.1 ABC transporter ATP-binding protein [Pseudoalteromonas sp. SR43-5]MBB1325723.1 ABC transporter ATP-binding protein [Pseudoalteromonas sp. SR45-1]MBB1354664.1 ABC transporter ATP-binding protein [Pseudoalteromonas sp. SR45-5]MBB1429949.1 ABC transporter ATP-binding protein [Pseudoalteromonas sp. SG43-4]MBH0031357.1 ABC transporter ATP-binding protein [Pseudoalteromonas sp. SWYJZ98]